MTARFEWQINVLHDGAQAVRMCPKPAVSTAFCIAIVEPDALIRELLERWLCEAGYEVISASRDHPPDMDIPNLVIADISDPVGAGDTIEALQSSYAAPILALSARFRRGLAGASEPAPRFHVGQVRPTPFTREELNWALPESHKQA